MNKQGNLLSIKENTKKIEMLKCQRKLFKKKRRTSAKKRRKNTFNIAGMECDDEYADVVNENAMIIENEEDINENRKENVLFITEILSEKMEISCQI